MSNKKRKVEIMDTTLRDGEQTHNVAYTPTEKLQLAQMLLEKVNVDRIEIASARVSEGEKEGARKITEWATKTNPSLLERIEILGFVDDKRSVNWIYEAGGRKLNLLTKGSLNHLQKQLRKSPQQHFKDIARVIEYANQKQITVNVYLEDWSNGYRNSRDYTYELISFLLTLPVERIMLPDTLGIMYPTEVFVAFQELTQRFPNTHFDFHPHNDYGLGTINVLEAIRGGARGVHVTVNCLGERTGNASLAEVVANIHDHLKLKTQVNEKSLYFISRLVETYSGKRLAANAPIVGEDVFTQTAGIHADGDKKGGLYENLLLPQRFGRKRSYALGKLAGKASLEHNLKEMGIELSEENHLKVLQRIVELGDQKKIITAEDLPFIIADVLHIPAQKKIVFENVVITSGTSTTPMCSLWLRYQEKEYRFSGYGNGGYDAFMQALRQFSSVIAFELPKLIDYEVRIPPGGQTSALVECKITWQKLNSEDVITTRGVDPDQTIAAVRATEKMLNQVLP